MIERGLSPQKQTEEQQTVELKRSKNAWKLKRSNSSENSEEVFLTYIFFKKLRNISRKLKKLFEVY